MAFEPIKTPRGSIVKTDKGNVSLVWNPDFTGKRNESFSRQQKFIDSEVLRRCSPRVPHDTGMLEKSGKLGTVVGSGEVNYIAPYAAAQYYGTAASRSYDPNRGGNWFERTKVAEKDEILKGAEKVV